jgi:hypothetical protein
VAFWKRMAEAEVDTERLPEYQLIADVGNPYEDEGLTRAILSGSGRMLVELHRAEPATTPERGQGYLSPESPSQETGDSGRAMPARSHAYDFGPESAKEMILRAARFPWGQRFPTRPGIPSEPVLQWTLRDERGPEVTVSVWLRDAEKDDTMAPVLSAFRHAVERATKGELFL